MTGKKAALVGVLALAWTAGCGASASSGSKDDAATLIAASADKTTAAKNAKVVFTGAVSGPNGTLDLTGPGVQDFVTNDLSIDFRVASGGQVKGTIEELFVNDVLYIELPPEARSQAGGKAWLSIDYKKLTGASASASLDSYNQNPAAFLSTLKDVSQSVTNLGSVVIRGVHTTHYRAVVDVQKAAKSRGDRSDIISKYGNELSPTLPEDVYLDANGLTRRISFAIVPKPGSTAAKTITSEKISMDFFDFGKADTSSISAPPADQTVDSSTLTRSGGTGG